LLKLAEKAGDPDTVSVVAVSVDLRGGGVPVLIVTSEDV
jgi:hypothetical protein